MAEAKGSTLVYILIVVLSLISFGLAIAAERHRTVGTIIQDPIFNTKYCVYNSNVATGYGIGSFIFLLASESLLMSVTKCICFGKPQTFGRDRSCSVISFISSLITFLIAEACLIAGATKNTHHTKYLKAENFVCESLRKGIFIGGAVFVVATMILNVFYYHYFTKYVSLTPVNKTNQSGSTVGMAGYV